MQRLRVSYKNLELLEIIQKTLCKAGAAPKFFVKSRKLFIHIYVLMR